MRTDIPEQEPRGGSFLSEQPRHQTATFCSFADSEMRSVKRLYLPHQCSQTAPPVEKSLHHHQRKEARCIKTQFYSKEKNKFNMAVMFQVLGDRRFVFKPPCLNPELLRLSAESIPRKQGVFVIIRATSCNYFMLVGWNGVFGELK